MKKTTIALIGNFQDGKSTLINALCGSSVAAEGDLAGPKTEKATIYAIPGTDCELLDTPGFDSGRGGDDATAFTAIQRADVFFLVLRDAKLSEQLQENILRCFAETQGGMRPLLPIINEWEEHPPKQKRLLNKNAVGILHKRRLFPLLFGEEMPIVNARAWASSGSTDDNYAEGERRLKYLLGMEPQAIPSPLTRICAMMRAVQQLTK